MVDGYRDLISGAMDTHLSMVSNRLNVVMKQLAIIATIFLPLGFLTGFFGQNFAWPIAHLQVGLGHFLLLGIGTELVALVILFVLFKRRGWLGSGPTRETYNVPISRYDIVDATAWVRPAVEIEPRRPPVLHPDALVGLKSETTRSGADRSRPPKRFDDLRVCRLLGTGDVVLESSARSQSCSAFGLRSCLSDVPS